MADELDENYTLDKKFSTQEPADESISDEDYEEQPQKKLKSNKFESKSNERINSNNNKQESKKKPKKKNITEILELKKKELNTPSYAYNEFKNHVSKFIADNLSSVEKNDFNLNENLPDKLNELIMKRNNKSMLPFEEQFQKVFVKKLENYLQKENSEKKAKPFAIVLCSSALRCIELQKKLDSAIDLFKKKKIKWMHAFAKHKKLNDQINFIKNCKTPIHLVFATPNRLAQLIDANALKLNLLRYVIVDYTARDCKLKRFMDMPDLKEEFFKLTHKYLFGVNKEKIKFKFYLA